jgi:hypothetical protein
LPSPFSIRYLSQNLLAELKQRREKLLLKLRESCPEIAAQLIQLNVAISGLEAGSVGNGEYSGFRKPSEALFSYLDQTAKPQVREDICRALVNGGYGNGTEASYWILMRMANYQTEKGRLVKINGLIGKKEWPKKIVCEGGGLKGVGMDAEEHQLEEIKKLEEKLAKAQIMLQSIRATKRKVGDASMRFFDWSPIDAARTVLEEHGKRMKKSKVIELLVAGGLSVGKKRPMVNIRRSFEKNIELGNLIEDGDYLDIPARKPAATRIL